MNPRVSQAITIVGAVVGVVSAGLTVAGLLERRRNSQDQADKPDDPYAGEPFGLLEPDRSRTVAADDGVPLSVEEVDPADGGKPDLTVVLVHGLAVSRLCWHFQRRDLAKSTEPRVRQVLYDQRGHGRSGQPAAESCTIDQLGRDLDSVLRSVAPEGPLVLVGHSMGGMAIMALAEARPELFVERVRGVALLSTSAGEVGSAGLPRTLLSRYNPLTRTVAEMAAWQPSVVDWLRAVGGGLTRQGVRRLAFGSWSVPTSLVDFMVDMLDVTPVRVLTDFVPTLGTHDRYAGLAGLRHCETLLISGDRDRITPVSHTERIATDLPDAQVTRAVGAGHMVMLEQPDLVTDELLGLLHRCTVKAKGQWWKWRK